MADTPKIRVANGWAAISRAAAPIFNIVCSQLLLSPARDVRQVEPPRLTIAEQWGRISGIITGAASRAEEATRCHASATLQLDLAQYALTSLVDELAAVMDVGGRRRRATVHVLGIAPPSPPRPTMGNAIAA